MGWVSILSPFFCFLGIVLFACMDLIQLLNAFVVASIDAEVECWVSLALVPAIREQYMSSSVCTLLQPFPI